MPKPKKNTTRKKKSSSQNVLSTKIRKRHNEDLLKRMKAGESLTNYDAIDSWFPSRPLIKKDRDAMARLYNNPSLGESKKLESTKSSKSANSKKITKSKSPKKTK